MEREGPIPNSQKFSTCSYNEPGQSRPIQPTSRHYTSPKTILILCTHIHLGLFSGLFPSGFPTIPQTGSSRVRYPMGWFLKFTFSFRPHYARGFTQSLTAMSTRNIKIIMFPGSKVRRVRRADNLTDISADCLTMSDP
jgi:hypothetical protein